MNCFAAAPAMALQDFLGPILAEKDATLSTLDAAKKTASAEKWPKSVCEGCTNLDFCRQICDNPMITDESFVLDTSIHGGLCSLSAMQESALKCSLCDFLWQGFEMSMRKLLGVYNAPLHLSPWDHCGIAAHAERISKECVVMVGFWVVSAPPASLRNMKDIQKNRIFPLQQHILEPFKQRLEHGQDPLVLWMVEPDPMSSQVRKRVRMWLEECETHVWCKSSASRLPDRYLDVGESGVETIKMIESDRTAVGKYIALSYCWGDANHCVLKKSNIDVLKAGSSENALPPTLRDAVSLARALQIRFVWIDSLCIIQDDEEDWEEQSGKMGDIYGRAYLTVCASKASAANQGFLQPRSPTHHFCGLLKGVGKQIPVYMHRAKTKRSLEHMFITGTIQGPLFAEPLTPRAWTVQERMLSVRSLYFASQQIFWACQQVTRTEDGLETSGQSEDLTGLTATNAQHKWFRMCSQYSTCRLTKEKDRLPALSGIAKIFQKIINDRYYAGHWENNLVQSLHWWCSPSSSRLGSLNLIPSWSWASINGAVTGKRHSHLDPEILAIPLETAVSPVGLDPHGTVAQGGYIVLRAPCIGCTLSQPKKSSRPHDRNIWMMELACSGRSAQTEAFLDEREKSVSYSAADETIKVHAKLMLTMYRPEGKREEDGKITWALCGLLIERVGEQFRDTYRRIGAVDCLEAVEISDSRFRDIKLV